MSSKQCEKVPQYKCNKNCGLGCLGCKTYKIYAKGLQDGKKVYEKVIEPFKYIPLEITYDESTDEWHLYVILRTQDDEYKELLTWGDGKETYELLKKELNI